MRQHSTLIESTSNFKRISNTLATMIERSIDAYHTNEPNDTLAIKSHYIKTLIDFLLEKKTDEFDKTIGEICKKFAHGNETNGFKMFEEKFLREKIRDFPYKQNPLLQQLVRQIAPITLVNFHHRSFINAFFSIYQGDFPTALTIFTNTINGRTFEDDAANRCETCNEPNAPRRCTACKSVRFALIRYLIRIFLGFRFIIVTKIVNVFDGQRTNVSVRNNEEEEKTSHLFI